jgi:hypothetical protein
MIDGVNHSETVTNEKGGKQSRLDYRFDLIDARVMFELAKVMHEGAKKYEKDNWRKISVDDHLNHAQSHIWAYQAGDKQDNHLSHAFTRLMMALAVSMQEKPKKGDMRCRACHFRYMTKESLDKLGLDPCMNCNNQSNWRAIEDDEWNRHG